MKFYSTLNPKQSVTLKEAVLHGLAPDGGLYMPEYLPMFTHAFLLQAEKLSLREIAMETATLFLHDDFTAAATDEMVTAAINFPCTMKPLSRGVHILELFNGPTLAFKDFGARFLAQLLKRMAREREREIYVLTATSGDTGSAVAHAFLHVPGVQVVILYPKNRVTDLQEKQFASLGQNIHAIEIDGSFDDCQQLVKTAFQDPVVKEKITLASANSINIGRLLPQTFYYIYAWSRLQHQPNLVFSVPSGNYGNLLAGLFVKRMGLNIHKFIAATNANSVFPDYLRTKKVEPRPSVATISNAMDVGNPSNVNRILDLYRNKWEAITHDITGYACSDDETRAAMCSVYADHRYTLDPHGAVAYCALKKYQATYPNTTGVLLETAHPAKFDDVVSDTLNKHVYLPVALQVLKNRRVLSDACENDYTTFRELLLTLNN